MVSNSIPVGRSWNVLPLSYAVPVSGQGECGDTTPDMPTLQQSSLQTLCIPHAQCPTGGFCGCMSRLHQVPCQTTFVKMAHLPKSSLQQQILRGKWQPPSPRALPEQGRGGGGWSMGGGEGGGGEGTPCMTFRRVAVSLQGGSPPAPPERTQYPARRKVDGNDQFSTWKYHVVDRKQSKIIIVGHSGASPSQTTTNKNKQDIANYQPLTALCFVFTNS